MGSYFTADVLLFSGRIRNASETRERSRAGPWFNAKGVVVAKDLAEFHGANNLTRQTALNEKGGIFNGRGNNPNTRGILTGSNPDGATFGGDPDRTCSNWTSSGKEAAVVGHSDRTGLDGSAPARSWNSKRLSRGPGGCGQHDLKTIGGGAALLLRGGLTKAHHELLACNIRVGIRYSQGALMPINKGRFRLTGVPQGACFVRE